MKYAKCLLIIAFIMLNTFAFAQDAFLGEWIISNPPDNYRGISRIGIEAEIGKIKVVLMGNYNLVGYYDSDNMELYYAMQGMGYDGPLVKLKLEGDYLRAYYLKNKGWQKDSLLYKRKK